MLPPEHRTPRSDYLERLVLALGDDAMRLPPANDEQALILMRFMQSYCFIELNERRSIETFVAAGMLDLTAKEIANLKATKLTPTLLGVVEKMASNEEADLPDTLGKLKEIGLRRTWRNMFAHFAAKQIPNEDALLMLCVSGWDFKQVFDEDPRPDAVMWSIVDMPDMRGLREHMAKYEVWLAKKAVEWFKRYNKEPELPPSF